MDELRARVATIEIINADTGSVEIDVNSLLASWYSQFESILDDMVPLKPLPRRKHVLPWVNSSIKKLISQRNKLAKTIFRGPVLATDEQCD